MAKFRTNLAEVSRLRGKGLVAFEVDGVLARMTKAQSRRALLDLDFGRQMRSIVTMAAMVAKHMRARVQAGRLASSRRGFRASGARFTVAGPYALTAGRAPGAGSSREWHAGQTNLFSNTGGMWKGLQARGSGRNSAIIDFRGTSLGGSGKPKKKGTKRQKSTRLNVRNQQKAGRIMHSLRVNVVQPTEAENIAMASAVAAQHHITLQASLGGQPPGTRAATGDARLHTLLMRRWVKR